jgi:hypothetical protein
VGNSGTPAKNKQ